MILYLYNKGINLTTNRINLEMNALTREDLESSFTSCDKRIAALHDKVSFWKVLNLVGLSMKYQELINDHENIIKMIKTEKLIYTALANPNSARAIFPKLLAKFDELLSGALDHRSKLVTTGFKQEGEYLDFCKAALENREYIKLLCRYGEER